MRAQRLPRDLINRYSSWAVLSTLSLSVCGCLSVSVCLCSCCVVWGCAGSGSVCLCPVCSVCA